MTSRAILSTLELAEEDDLFDNPSAKPEKAFKYIFGTTILLSATMKLMTDCLKDAKNRMYWWNLHEQKLKEYENKSNEEIENRIKTSKMRQKQIQNIKEKYLIKEESKSIQEDYKSENIEDEL